MHSNETRSVSKRLESTSLVTSLAPTLAGPCSVDTLLSRLSCLVAEAAGCQSARLYLVDRARKELHCRVSSEPSDYELRLPVGTGLHGQVLDTQQAQTTRSPTTGDTFLLQPVLACGSSAGAPTSRDVVGILEVARSRDEGGLDAEVADRLVGIAEEVARVLAHTRLDDSRLAPERFTELIGSSAAMLALYSNIEAAAAARGPMAIEGAHGTGKALIARAIHHLSSRRAAPLITLRCHADHAFLDAELFGVPGQMAGALERASGGTLVVEQASHLPIAVQDQLLTRAAYFNVRTIATLLRGTSSPTDASRLAPKLSAPFHGATIAVPTLAERGPDDIDMLARHFVRSCGATLQNPHLGIDPGALANLRAQPWPGHVQELEKCVQSAVLACDADTVGPEHLSLPNTSSAGALSDCIPSGLLLADAEERYILRTLTENSENRTRTATSLGIGRNTLVRKIKQYRNK